MNKIYSTIMVCLLLLSVKVHAQITLTATGGTPTGSFTTIKGAFDAINLGTHQGVIDIRVHGNTTETALAQLDSSGNTTGSSYTSILIRPADTATSVKTISSSVSGVTLMRFNGADNVTIDGRPLSTGTSNLLTLLHTANIAASHTIEFINSAQSNVIKFATVQNSSIGTILCSAVRLTTGLNNNNLFQNAIINGGNLGIEINGSDLTPNNNTTIQYCLLTNQKATAIRLAAGVGNTNIDSNNITHSIASTTGGYQVANITIIAPTATVNITKNRAFDLNMSAANFLQGVIFSPAVASGTLVLRNNAFSLGSATFPNTTSQIIRCLLFGGAGSATVIAEHNTFRIGGTHVTANGNPTTVGLLKSNTSTLTSFTFKNNLCINTRTGSASQHVGSFVSTPVTGTNNVDFNTIAGGGAFTAAWLGTFYNDIALYKAAATPNEQNSTLGVVDFNNTVDPTVNLNGVNTGGAKLLGTPTSVSTDYFGNARNPVKPYRGAYESSLPIDTFDLQTQIIYTFGKIPIGTTDTARVIVRNQGSQSAINKNIFLYSSKAGLIGSVQVSMNPGDQVTINLPPYIPALLGFDTLYTFPEPDQKSSNDTSMWVRENTLNALSYSRPFVNQFGNVGTNPQGEIVAKFFTPVPNILNQVNVNFTNAFFNGPFPFQIVIYEDSGSTFGPKFNPLWESTIQQTVNGVFNLPIPAVNVNGNFFIGVRQTTANNIGFAYQNENPIRNRTFYFRQGAAFQTLPWNDFAVNATNQFRFMIEPRLAINDDLGVTDLFAPATGCVNLGTSNVEFSVENLGLLNQNFASDSLVLYGTIQKPSGNIISFGPVTVKTGTLNSGATLNVLAFPNFNFDTIGNYTFTAWTKFAPDANGINDTLPALVRTVTAVIASPFNQTFNAALTFPTNWTTNRFFVGNATGVLGTNSARVGIDGAAPFTANAFIQSPRISGITANSILRFDYKIINNVGGAAAVLQNLDSIKVLISTDCGLTYTRVGLIGISNHVSSLNFATFAVQLGTFLGNNIVVKLECDWFGSTNNVVLDIDNIRVVDGVNDAGITASSAPCRSVILGSAAFAPMVTATNFGSSPQTNVPVNVAITGPANYTGTATIASLNFGSTALATLTTNFNPTVAGTYTLKAWTSLTGDGDPSNDTLTFTFNVTNTAIPIASGNALNFGVGSLARIAEKSVHNPASELTIETWVNKVTTGFERTIVAKDSAFGFIQYELAITTGDSLKLTVFNSNGFYQLFSNILVPTGFNHLAATISANNMRMYINGRIVMDTVIPTSTFMTFNTDVFVGNNNLATQPLRGQLDELRIWNIARTPTQIRNMMHTRMANSAHANLVGYYRFDEGAGNTFVTDASGNCNTAIFGTTAPTWVAVTYPLGQPVVDSAIVNINGTYNMPAVGIELSYTGFVGDDSIHVHRFNGAQLGTSPITTPGGVTTVHPAYWVAYRYGTGTSTATNLKFTLPNGNLNSGVVAADVKLFNRAPNATAGWTLANNTASAASFANQTVEFAQLQSIFGNQLMIGANNNPLPVTLVSFTASASRADAVLRWNTSSEVNSQGFAVERSTDGRNFTEIGFVRSTGNSNRVVNYSFADKNIFATQRTAYYRLKLVDNNGRFTYTRNVQVTVTNKTTPQVSVYPNPVRDALYVEVDAINNSAAQINVYDITGKVIKHLAVNLTEGFNKFAIEDVEHMNNGVYFISVTANSQVIHTGKIVKTH